MQENLLKDIDVRMVNRDELVDINDVIIDPNLSKKDRIISYIKQIKNPYCYKDGNTVVKISFSNTSATIEDCIINYLKGI